MISGFESTRRTLAKGFGDSQIQPGLTPRPASLGLVSRKHNHAIILTEVTRFNPGQLLSPHTRIPGKNQKILERRIGHIGFEVSPLFRSYVIFSGFRRTLFKMFHRANLNQPILLGQAKQPLTARPKLCREFAFHVLWIEIMTEIWLKRTLSATVSPLNYWANLSKHILYHCHVFSDREVFISSKAS